VDGRATTVIASWHIITIPVYESSYLRNMKSAGENAHMHTYCKAYKLRDIRQFSDWAEKPAENAPELSDDAIVYLWDDYTVVQSPIQNTRVLFDAVTPAWQDFCTQTLQFSVPAAANA
jgi:hypothetical protein